MFSGDFHSNFVKTKDCLVKGKHCCPHYYSYILLMLASESKGKSMVKYRANTWTKQTLSHTTNFLLCQTVFAVDNFKVDENGRKFSRHVENNVGKGEIFPFLTVFSKALYCRPVKTRACMRKG